MFEQTLLGFQTELTDCELLCDDALSVNISHGVHPDKLQLYEDRELTMDTLEYYELLKLISIEVC